MDEATRTGLELLNDPSKLTPVFTLAETLLFFLVSWTFAGFMFSRLLRRNDIADLLWGSGIMLLSVSVAFLTGDAPLNLIQWVAISLVSLWGLRLTLFLAVRNLPEPEDSRYAAWRKEWGPREPVIALLRVFLLQTCLAIPVSAAAWAKLLERSPHAIPSVWDGMAVGAALIGLVIESVADLHLYLYRTRRRASGATGHGVLTTGLWSWSRHPNYFGESLFWWGIACIGIFSGTWIQALLSLAGAGLIHFLLLRVSGVIMTERGMKSRRQAPEFERYLQETPRFIPLPPSIRRFRGLDPS